jgi:ABC-type Fe3+/spermidine/putrescine transport system ATPase subunit
MTALPPYERPTNTVFQHYAFPAPHGGNAFGLRRRAGRARDPDTARAEMVRWSFAWEGAAHQLPQGRSAELRGGGDGRARLDELRPRWTLLRKKQVR